MAKVLLVEDDNNLREIYEARLQAEGYDIVSAQDGEEALVVAKNEKPDLIISDVMMPKISGFEMLDILRNTEGLRDAKVIMLTALGQAEDQHRADKLGADRYLVKSQVTLEDIVKVAHELLGDGPAAPAAAPATASDSSAPAAPASPVTPTDATVAVATPPMPPMEPSKSGVSELSEAPAVTDDSKTEQSDGTPTPSIDATPPSDSAASSPSDSSAPSASAFSPVDTSPPADDTSTTDDAAAVAPTAAEEEAVVETQIADFVQSAPAEAPAAQDVSNDTSTPSADDSQPASQTSDTTATDSTSASDQLMSNAVDSLVAGTPAQDTGSHSDDAVTVNPTQEPVAPEDEEPSITQAPEHSATTSINGENTVVAHKKVIQPPDSEPKKSLDELLAVEEAKEASTSPPAPPVVGDSTTPPKPKDGFDPNSIAL